MRCRHKDRLWKEYLRDPSLWWDLRKTKANPSAPDFKHKLTQEPLWLEGACNALGVTPGPQEIKDFWTPQAVPNLNEEEKGVENVMSMKSIGNVSVWASLSLEEALDALEKRSLLHPSVEDVSYILKKCKEEREWSHALRLYAYLQRKGLEGHGSLADDLVSMRAEIASMNESQKHFKKLAHCDTSSWSLLEGYADSEKPWDALRLYKQMPKDVTVCLNGPVFVALIKACTKLKDLSSGIELHVEVARNNLLESDTFVAGSLLDMYVECGFFEKAEELFDTVTTRDIVLWNTLIGGCSKWGHPKKALKCFAHMQSEGFSPDAFTFASTLKACGSLRATKKGQEIHAEVERKGLLERDAFIGSTLIGMYAKSGLLTQAKEVLDRLAIRDIVAWTVLITGYAEHGYGEESLRCLEEMLHDGITPNAVTLVCGLKACGKAGAIDKGREMHAEIERAGLLTKDHLLGSTLVDMYAKCGLLLKAQEVFDVLPIKSVVSCTALISGYIEHGHGEEGLNCFKKMQLAAVVPDAVVFICCLKACGSLAAADKGLELHGEIEKRGLREADPVVGNALVDMYARCGLLASAQQVFDNLSHKNVVTCNSLIAGYAKLGDYQNVFLTYDRMGEEDIKPDLVTFVVLLDVCSQTGLYDKGEVYFKLMSNDHGIAPVLEHHTCMVDLLGRAGLLDKAVMLIRRLPLCLDLAMWLTLLGACKKWGNMDVAKQAFEEAVRLDKRDGAAYSLLSSVYADAGMEEEVNHIEVLRVENQAGNAAQ